MSTTSRLMMSYLAVTLAILLVLGIPLGVFFRALEVDRFTADIQQDASTLATLVEEDLETGSPVDPSTAERYAETTGARVVVTDAEGISLVDTAAQTDRDLSTRPEIREALEGASSSGTRRSDTLDDDLLYVATPVASGGQVYGTVRLTLTTHELNERVARFWLSVTAAGALVLLLAAAVGWAMARWVSRPLRGLVTTAERFSTGDLSPEPEQAGAPAEIAVLQRNMNEMATRLDAQFVQQKAFVGDASHQLRTPLTALRLRLENAHEAIADLDPAPDNLDPSDDEVNMVAAIAEVDRLSELVTSLLRLARAEQPTETSEVVDLVALTRDRADTWAAVAEAENVDLSFHSDHPGIDVVAVAGGVEQVLDNLIDNAVAATPPQGHVRLKVGRDAAGPWLIVSDSGPGLDEEEKARALDRFWRGDHQRQGSGLGLPIVQELLRAGGGSLSLADSSEGGLEIKVRLRSPG